LVRFPPSEKMSQLGPEHLDADLAGQLLVERGSLLDHRAPFEPDLQQLVDRQVATRRSSSATITRSIEQLLNQQVEVADSSQAPAG
jgi:hypothetical protein